MPLADQLSLHDTQGVPTHNRRGQQMQITLTANQLQFTSLPFKVLESFGGFVGGGFF